MQINRHLLFNTLLMGIEISTAFLKGYLAICITNLKNIHSL